MGRKLFSCILAVALAVLMIPSASIAYAVESASDQPDNSENQTFDVTASIGGGTFTGDPTATRSQAYTGTIVPNAGYNRPEEVTVTVGGSLLAADKYSYDASTGAIAIAGNAVTGNIAITAECTAAVYTVTGNIANGFIEGDEQVTYGQAYTATAVPEPGYDPPVTITVTVAGTTLTNGYTYNAQGGAIEIQADKITGPIIITGECAEQTYQVTHAITNGSFEGDATATYYHAYTATIRAAEHYALPETITVTVIDRRLLEGEYEYSPETGALEVLAGKVVGPIGITAVCEPATYAVADNIENGSFTGAAATTYGQPYTAIIAANEHYSLPASITVTVAGTALADGFTYDSATGAVAIDASKVTGDIAITAACVADTYAVTGSIENGTFSGAATATYGLPYTATIAADEHYSLPASITVTVGGAELADGYSYNSGAISIDASKITGDIAITAACVADTYGVTGTVTDGSFDGDAKATYGQAYTATIAANEHYSLPASITVTVAGTALADGFTYDSTTGAVAIDASKVTGDIAITAACVADTYDVTAAITNGSFDGDTQAIYGQAYTATVSPNAGYEPPVTVSVTAAGTPLAEGDFSYTAATGKIEIPAAKVTGAIDITAVCDAAVHPVQTDVQHGTVTGPGTATYGQEYTATASADTGYILPAAISITVGGTELADGFAYDDQTGAITINGDKITGTVVIAAVCTARTFTVDFEQEGGTAPLASIVATYGSPMPAISGDNLPVREGYEFLGYWTEKNGQGTQYYHADGTSAHNWDKASPATLYANWTAHYGILEGAALTHQVGDGQACAVRINADIVKFLNVYVDGVLVDPANYDVTEGSTIVTYKQSYLDTLSAGVHSARYQFTDGYAGSTITIAAAEKSAPDGSGSGAEIAKTGDSMTMTSWLALICFISAAIACFALYRGKATPQGQAQSIVRSD